jgi:hypothetical protein
MRVTHSSRQTANRRLISSSSSNGISRAIAALLWPLQARPALAAQPSAPTVALLT